MKSLIAAISLSLLALPAHAQEKNPGPSAAQKK